MYRFVFCSGLEAEASVPEKRTLKFSEPELEFVTYMMNKYGEDYKVRSAVCLILFVKVRTKFVA